MEMYILWLEIQVAILFVRERLEGSFMETRPLKLFLKEIENKLIPNW